MEGAPNTIEAGLSKLGSAKPHALSSSRKVYRGIALNRRSPLWSKV